MRFRHVLASWRPNRPYRFWGRLSPPILCLLLIICLLPGNVRGGITGITTDSRERNSAHGH